jgi:cysteine synthase
VKDRVALQSKSHLWSSGGADQAVIEDAEEQGLIHPHTGTVLFEGTVGSTGISLATVGRAKYVTFMTCRSRLTLQGLRMLYRYA